MLLWVLFACKVFEEIVGGEEMEEELEGSVIASGGGSGPVSGIFALCGMSDLFFINRMCSRKDKVLGSAYSWKYRRLT